jgi:hypothetical protein
MSAADQDWPTLLRDYEAAVATFESWSLPRKELARR